MLRIIISYVQSFLLQVLRYQLVQLSVDSANSKSLGILLLERKERQMDIGKEQYHLIFRHRLISHLDLQTPQQAVPAHPLNRLKTDWYLHQILHKVPNIMQHKQQRHTLRPLLTGGLRLIPILEVHRPTDHRCHLDTGDFQGHLAQELHLSLMVQFQWGISLQQTPSRGKFF